MDQKRENRPKKEETNQQNENLKLFLKTGNRHKKGITDPKKEETDHQTEDLKLFLKTGNRPKKTGNESNVIIAETNPKYLEIPQHFSVYEGFLIIPEKRRKRTQTHLWVRFHVSSSIHFQFYQSKFSLVHYLDL